jgi:polysaccharide deacetylase family protein (PEP-CTERM system associated)
MSHPAPDLLTVDVEDWYHVLRFNSAAAPHWSMFPSHTEEDTRRLLDLLDEHGATATFFVIGRLAERSPRLVRYIAGRGHAVASHGYDHISPERMTARQFVEDLRKSKGVLEEVSGARVVGYRAPWFGIRRCTYPFYEILADEGFLYDSSAFPGVCPGRGRPGVARAAPPRGRRSVTEIPVSAVSVLHVPIVFSGGGFLRLLPLWFVEWGVQETHRRGKAVVYYLHPRDLNPDSPRLFLPPWRGVRYYGGRRTMQHKVKTLLALRRCTSIEAHLGWEGRAA